MAIKIYTIADLQNINNNLAGNYELAQNIDASGFSFDPIGDSTNHFTGILNGKNHKIMNLTITISGSGTQRGALIDTNEGTIQNLDLENCQISITSTNGNAYGGGIAVDNSGGTISNCGVTGNIIAIGWGTVGWTEVGGIAAFNSGLISKSHSTATITVTSNKDASAGGLIDWNEGGGEIDQSYAIGNISVSAFVSGKKMYAAGLVSDNDGEISDSYARGNASASGGSTSNYAAGLIEDNEGTITDSYSTGIATGASGTGGLCRNNSGSIDDCFWDTQTSGTTISDGGTGKTTSQMKTRSTFTSAGWDFIVIWGINGITNNGYPFHWAMPPEPLPDSPRKTTPIDDIVTLEAIRNIEMSSQGRFRTDAEGNAVYKSRYGRNP